METDTFPREDVKKFFSTIIPAKIDRSKDDKSFKLHNGKGIPLILLMDPDGKVWSRADGKPPDLLASFASDLWNPGVELSNQGKSMEAFEYWGRLAMLFPDSDLAKQARENIARWESDPAFKSQMDEKRTKWIGEPMIKQADALIKKKKTEDARALLEKVVTDFPSLAEEAQKRLDKLPKKK